MKCKECGEIKSERTGMNIHKDQGEGWICFDCLEEAEAKADAQRKGGL